MQEWVSSVVSFRVSDEYDCVVEQKRRIGGDVSALMLVELAAVHSSTTIQKNNFVSDNSSAHCQSLLASWQGNGKLSGQWRRWNSWSWWFYGELRHAWQERAFHYYSINSGTNHLTYSATSPSNLLRVDVGSCSACCSMSSYREMVHADPTHYHCFNNYRSSINKHGGQNNIISSYSHHFIIECIRMSPKTCMHTANGKR